MLYIAIGSLGFLLIHLFDVVSLKRIPRVKPGIWMLARRTGMPVYPVGVAVRDAWTAGSWDEFLIPKPFTRIVVRFGEPLYVDDYAGRDDFCSALRQAMFDETAACWRTLRPDDNGITTKDTKRTKNNGKGCKMDPSDSPILSGRSS